MFENRLRSLKVTDSLKVETFLRHSVYNENAQTFLLLFITVTDVLTYRKKREHYTDILCQCMGIIRCLQCRQSYKYFLFGRPYCYFRLSVVVAISWEHFLWSRYGRKPQIFTEISIARNTRGKVLPLSSTASTSAFSFFLSI